MRLSYCTVETHLYLAIWVPRAGGFRRIIRPADRQITLLPQRSCGQFRTTQGGKWEEKRLERVRREKNDDEEKVFFLSDTDHTTGVKWKQTVIRKELIT